MATTIANIAGTYQVKTMKRRLSWCSCSFWQSFYCRCCHHCCRWANLGNWVRRAVPDRAKSTNCSNLARLVDPSPSSAWTGRDCLSSRCTQICFFIQGTVAGVLDWRRSSRAGSYTRALGSFSYPPQLLSPFAKRPPFSWKTFSLSSTPGTLSGPNDIA